MKITHPKIEIEGGGAEITTPSQIRFFPSCNSPQPVSRYHRPIPTLFRWAGASGIIFLFNLKQGSEKVESHQVTFHSRVPMRSMSLPTGEARVEEPPRGYHKPPGKTPGQIYLKRKVGCGPIK